MPSLEYLRKLAKDRLKELRRTNPAAKLAAVQLAIAREQGFSSWRALKAALEKQPATQVTQFFEACGAGDVATLRGLLAIDPSLARLANPEGHHGGWTGLHTAAQRGNLEAVRLLLEHGADPNAREAGDNTYPLHWAAAHRHIPIAQALLAAGGDVHGLGDVHELDVIGWGTFFRPHDEVPGRPSNSTRDMAAFLVSRGARHHIFSAMSLADLELIRQVVAQNPLALDRRLSRFEQGQTPLHLAMSWKRYDVLDLLIELGADLEAKDGHGHSVLETAMLGGDREAIPRLLSAGARRPKTTSGAGFQASMTKLGDSVKKVIPMIHVPDVARTLEWYRSIGFKELGRYEDDGLVNWGWVSYGNAQLMLNMHGKAGDHDVSLWFYTEQVEELYQRLKSRQLEAALASGESGSGGIEFEQYLWDPPYGGREFGIRDLNGYVLYFRRG